MCWWCTQLLQGQNVDKLIEDGKIGEKGRSQEEALLSPQLCVPTVVALLLSLWLHQVCSCQVEAVCLEVDGAAAVSSDGELQPEQTLSIQGLNTSDNWHLAKLEPAQLQVFQQPSQFVHQIIPEVHLDWVKDNLHVQSLSPSLVADSLIIWTPARSSH